MRSDIFLLTRNASITKRLAHLSNARLHTVTVPSQINKLFKRNGKHLEVVLLDLSCPENDLNKFIFYIKQYNKDMPVFLLSAEHSQVIESEVMRNLAVYGYIKHPDKVEEIEGVLEDLNKLFELDMDKKFERVDYMEGENVFACTFKDLKKYFLKRDDILDNVDGEIMGIVIDAAGYHFTIQYTSGARSVVPWDYVKSMCDEKYGYYKDSGHANITAAEIAQKIKKQRQFLRLTQEDLAKKTGIQRPNIARIEAGRNTSSLETLEKIAKALSKPVVYFLTR